MEQEKAKGPVLLVDTGNALFKAPGLKSPEDKARAAFVLQTMARLGTQAMAPGLRDLNLGAQWLKAEADKAKLPVLSANLVDKAGKPIFAPSKVVEVGGKKIGLIGASPAGAVEGTHANGAKGLPAPAAVFAEAKKLRPTVDLIVVLAAMPYADSLQLSTELGGNVDFVLQSHDARGAGMAQRTEHNFVVPSGERGRQLGRLTLELGGKGPFVDTQEKARDEKTLKILGTQLEQVKKRQQMASDPAAKKQLAETQKQFVARQKEITARLQAGRKPGSRALTLEWIPLTDEFKEDATIAVGVKKIEPQGAEH